MVVRGNRRSRLAAVAGALFVAAGGCSTDDGPGAGQGSAAHVIGDEAVRVVGTAESLVAVRDLLVDGTGRIWLLNSTPPFFIGMDSGGVPFAEWGMSGEGPGEFRAPVALVRGTDPEEVWTLDVGRRRYLRISEGAEGVREVAPFAEPIRFISFDDLGLGGRRPWLVHADGGFVFARTAISPVGSTVTPQWTAEVVAVDPGAGTESVVFSLGAVVGDPAEAGVEMGALMPSPLWDLCSDGSYALYDPGARTVRRLAPGGAEAEPLPVPPPRAPVPVTLDRVFDAMWRQMLEERPPGFEVDREELRREFMRDAEREGAAEMLAPHFPEFIALHCAGADAFWLQRIDLDRGHMGRGPEWLRVSADGALREYLLPEGFRPYRFGSDRVWGTVRDALDVTYVAFGPLD